MTLSTRADVVSSFTVVKGAMIAETYAIFAAWNLEHSKRKNLDRLRAENYMGASSTAWLRDVAKVINRRFDPDGRDRPLVMLAQHGLPLDEWKPLMLWHMTRDEFLVRDFLQTWLFEAYEAGRFRIRTEELMGYLHSLTSRGAVLGRAWSDSTTKRVAAGLLKLGVEFGLLRGSVAREFVPYHLPERSVLYLLHALRDEALSPGRMLSAPDWRLFRMHPADVEQELLRLHQFRKLDYQVAGSLIQLSLPCASAREYAERMVA
ncbi:MAG: BrxA family protein [Myxococcota bacterium]